MKRFPKRLALTPPKYKQDEHLYTPIHVHSSYSVYDSCSPIGEIVEVVSSLGMKAVSLSDHGIMSGVYSFVQKCKEKSIKPIVGCEFYVNPRRKAEKKDAKNQHLCLFAMNFKGYKNLLKILYDALTKGFYYRGRTDLDYIAENSEGLICTTACQASPVFEPIIRGKQKEALKNFLFLRETFGDRFYLEFQFNELEVTKQMVKWLTFLSKRFGVNSVYGLDSHYTYMQDVFVQDILKLNRRKTTTQDPAWKEAVFDVRRLFIKPYDVALTDPGKMGFDISKKKVEQLLESTNKIADRVNFDLEFGLHAPKYHNKGKRVDVQKFLKLLLEKGFMRKVKNGIIPNGQIKEYRKRMDYEYKKILECGYPNYFLIIWDMVRESRKRGIYRGIGRGSASGSLVSFVLDINGVDPIKHGLLFERFMDVERKDPPDIDLDWESERRDEVESYLHEKYGEDKVARVATFSFWGTKSSLGEVYKTLGESREDIRLLSYWIRMNEGDNRDDKEIDEALKWIGENCREQRVLDLIDRQEHLGTQIAKRLTHNVRNIGLHPGGLVISPKPIFNYIPVIRHKNAIITGFSQGSDGRTELEDIGLIKIDNLGVNAVSVVKETIRLVRERQDVDLSEKIWRLNVEDKKIYEHYQNGFTEGVFQVESEQINRFIRRLKPECFEDLRAIVALYRPGALASGEAERFIKRKHGKEKIVYVHSSLKKYIGVTHGCFVYQEQMMSIMNELASFSRGEVLKSMRLLKKSYDTEDKRVLAIVKRLKKELKEKSKFSEKQAEDLTETMRQCYDYIFNKSHATAYALFSYQMMWLKCYYPLEFFCALLMRTQNIKTEHKGGKVKLKMKHYIDGAAKMGIEVLAPQFGYSKNDFQIENKNTIRAGTKVIVGIGKSSTELNKVEEGSSFEDFVCNEEISWQKLNRSKVDKLIKLGFFSGSVKIRKHITRKQLSKAWELYHKRKKKKYKRETLVQAIKDATKEVEGEYKRFELLEFQIELYRFFFSEHPLDSKEILRLIWAYNKKQTKKTLKIRKVSELNSSGVKRGTFVGYISDIKITTPKRGLSAGERMAIVTIEDKVDKAKVLVWPEFYSIPQYFKLLKAGSIVVMRVKQKSTEEGETKTWELANIQDKSHMISLQGLGSKIREKE